MMRTKEEQEISDNAPEGAEFYLPAKDCFVAGYLNNDKSLIYIPEGIAEWHSSEYSNMDDPICLEELRNKLPYVETIQGAIDIVAENFKDEVNNILSGIEENDKQKLTVGRAIGLGINFVEGDMRTSTSKTQGNVVMDKTLAEEHNQKVSKSLLDQEVLFFAWRDIDYIPEGKPFNIDIWTGTLFDKVLATDIRLDKVKKWRPSLVQQVARTVDITVKLPSIIRSVIIEGSLVDSATGDNLDNLEKSVGVEPQPVKWTTELAEQGVELEVGMLCSGKCLGNDEIKVTAIGKDFALVIDPDEKYSEDYIKIKDIVPIEVRSKKEIALEKQRDRLSEFFMANCDMKEVEFIQAMQDAGLLAEIED